jgi:hypothetical protein
MMSEGDFLAHFRAPVAQSGGWMAFCPSHSDGAKRGNRSLHICSDGDKWLLKCFAGCTAHQIVTAAGLELKDLSSRNSQPPHSKSPASRKPLTFKQLKEWWTDAQPLQEPSRKPTYTRAASKSITRS